MRISCLIFLIILMPDFSSAQLLPSIGISGLPNDNDSICSIPVYTGSFNNSGYFKGDTVSDFTLYDLYGDSVNLSNVLSGGNPVLLVAGSITCPVFRGKINSLNNMTSIYSGMLNIYVVYTVEAHPVIDPSPYSGTVWVPSSNFSEGVLYEQPDTYGERKSLVDSMLAKYTLNVPVLIDGPCNNWWLNYGPAPNNGYLINTSGVVVAKHAWFDKAPDNMYCDIDSLLGTNSGYCTSFGNNGNFLFSLDADSISYGIAGQTLSIHCKLTNNSTNNNVEIDIIKKQINTPVGWMTALCADVCYAPTVDSIRITIPPVTVQPFIFYFYTDSMAANGNVRVLFRNVNNNNNRHGQGFYGSTGLSTSIQSGASANRNLFEIFPVPAENQISIRTLTFTEGDYLITIFDESSIEKYQSKKSSVENPVNLDISFLNRGTFILECKDENLIVRKRFLKIE